MSTPYRVLVTGSREWDDLPTIREALRQVRNEDTTKPIVVVHGDCPRGADAIAAFLTRRATADFQMADEPHPADWKQYGKRAGFIRNAHMVNLGADICLAFIKDGSRGASHTAQLAEAAGIPTRRWTA